MEKIALKLAKYKLKVVQIHKRHISIVKGIHE